MMESLFKRAEEICVPAIVLSAQRYRIEDDKTGEVIEGIKLGYVESLEGVQRENFAGLPVLYITRPYEEWPMYEGEGILPAVCKVYGYNRSGPKGKPVFAPTRVEYVDTLLSAITE